MYEYLVLGVVVVVSVCSDGVALAPWLRAEGGACGLCDSDAIVIVALLAQLKEIGSKLPRQVLRTRKVGSCQMANSKKPSGTKARRSVEMSLSFQASSGTGYSIRRAASGRCQIWRNLHGADFF